MQLLITANVSFSYALLRRVWLCFSSVSLTIRQLKTAAKFSLYPSLLRLSKSGFLRHSLKDVSFSTLVVFHQIFNVSFSLNNPNWIRFSKYTLTSANKVLQSLSSTSALKKIQPISLGTLGHSVLQRHVANSCSIYNPPKPSSPFSAKLLPKQLVPNLYCGSGLFGHRNFPFC